MKWSSQPGAITQKKASSTFVPDRAIAALKASSSRSMAAVPFDLRRAGRDHALAVGRHRLLAGHEEQRPHAVHVLVEFSELVALAGAMPRGRKLTRLERARLDAGEMVSVIGDVARLPELAVADAVDPDLDLLAHGVGDGLLDLPVVDGLPAENSRRQVLAAGRDRQPAGVRGDDGLRAVPHVLSHPQMPGTNDARTIPLVFRHPTRSWRPRRVAGAAACVPCDRFNSFDKSARFNPI